MKALRFGRSAALLSVAAIALTACSSADSGNGGSDASGSAGGEQGTTSEVQGNLVGAGASSQEAAMTAWTQGVTETAPNLTVQYSPDGSGAGREKFLAGATSFAGSDAALKEDEAEQAKQFCGDNGAFHVPAYISPIAVAYNLPGVDEVKMDAETIAKVFSGEIKNWNDEAIAAQNEGVELPDTPITVVHRSDDSGTTENFTAYLTEAAGDAWSYDEVETWPSDITAESAQGTKGVVGLASQTEGAITYADASAVGELGTVSVKVGEEYVKYSAEAAAATVEKSEAKEDGSIELDRATDESGVYPVVLVSYHIYCNQYESQETVDQVKAFAEYVVSEDGQKTAEESAGNAPISEDTRTSKILGAALPMAFNRTPQHVPGMLLVGDAAGMVSPFNGEGIGFAMEAARIAADLAVQAHAAGSDAAADTVLSRYPVITQHLWGRHFALGARFARLIGDPRVMRASLGAGMAVPPLLRAVVKVMGNTVDPERGDAVDRAVRVLEAITPALTTADSAPLGRLAR